MAVTVELRDGNGAVLDRLDERSFELAMALPPVGDPDFPMLGLVDRYDDTFFSSLQMQLLVPEVERLQRLTPNPPVVLAQLAELAELCADGIGFFLVFLGD